jgi:UDP-2,3-diacylglucosamine pyrophosphatase LpxH
MTTKRIFLSDIHMGDERSLHQGPGSHPYCWFYNDPASGNRTAKLETFLKTRCIEDATVKETVILGDLFDEWVCPAGFEPTDSVHGTQQLENIVNAAQNQPVIKQLRILASQKRLKYIPGNHDMLADITIVQTLFQGIEFVNGFDGHGVYRGDGIWAEHGHWYGLFNAPYPALKSGGLGKSILPLGFFITRILAEETLKTGSSATLLKVLGEWADRINSSAAQARLSNKMTYSERYDLSQTVLEGLLDTFVTSHACNQPGVLMNGYDGIPGMVDWNQVKERYARIFSEWSGTHPDNVDPWDAIESDYGHLRSAARRVFLNHEDARIVIFGHTHKYECTSLLVPPPTRPLDEHLMPSDMSPIYANAGGWSNETPRCTFVETEFNPDTRYHIVRVREWKDVGGQYAAQEVDLCPDQWVWV